MRFIFCSSPMEDSRPDEMYQVEWDAAREHGFSCSLLDFEALTYENNLEKAIRKINGSSEGEPELAIFRGWMLTPQKYAELYESLLNKNVQLINDPSAYKHCHYLPEWFPLLSSRTPKSAWLTLMPGDSISLDATLEKLFDFVGKSAIVKDFVKSAKHHWLEACFIPDATDREHVDKVVQRFVELRGDELEGGLVFREFIELEPLATHSKSGMPLTVEFRLFVLDGKIIYCAKYWDEGDYKHISPPVNEFEAEAALVQSRFYTMDVALQKSGEWLILELGDAQVAGLPDDSCAGEFYISLARHLHTRD